MRRQVTVQQIHDEKRDVVQHVDAGQLVVELDAIEEHRLAPGQEDVPKVEISVTLANPTGFPAVVKQLAVLMQRLQGSLMETVA